MRCVFEVCCARAATGPVVKTVIPLMKSRRRIACPEAQDRASYRLKPTLGTAPLMSALGQKQTSEHDWIMSALLPIADIGTQSRNVQQKNAYSITSSALTSNEGGTVSPIAFAVARFISNSNFAAK